MKNKSNRLLYTLEVLLGVILMGGVFLIAVHVDVRSAKRTLTSTVSYIKEQCNQYERLNLASETKSMMRIIESVHQIDHALTENGTDAGTVTTEMLEQWARDSYVTGVLLLDENGKVQAQYGDPVDGLSTEELSEHMTSDALQDAILFSEKTYAMRFSCEDGSYADLAATGNVDGSGIVAAYYHTTLEYTRAFHLSVDTLLEGYNLEQDGTIVVSRGKEIIASNDGTLIGKSTDDVEILRKIKEAAASDQLIHARSETTALSHEFGLMEHGRHYYVYAYLPESDVFDSTIPSVMFSVIVYVIILAIIHMVRWKMAQNYREKQLSIQRQYNQQLQSKNEQLKQAVDQADRANVAKTSFLSRMSHDIRTPLNGIIGLLEIGETHPENTKLLQENQKKMKISANHLLSLINDILQMSKLESGEVVLSEEPMNLKNLSDDVLTIVEQRAAEAGVTLEYDKSTERVAFQNIYGSPLHVRQIFLNIYGNCIKYNRLGGKVQTSCKCLGVDQEIVTYQWTIQDTGVGMSQEFIRHIFDPFAQERSDARSVYNGTGLGMAIVKNLVDKMHGTIEVKSEEGVGSTFVITLPFRLAEEQPRKLLQQKCEDVVETVSIKGCRLLLVEDNELNAEIAEMLLKDQGAQVTVVTDGQQAVDRFASEPSGTFDVILMDVMMPVMDGLSATRRIRELDRPDAKTMPIIAMTANAYDEDVKQCLDAGMNAHLAKPLQMDLVVAVIGKYCN